jgi:ATP/maltotriose-dependent transcriptional regulator MalT
MIEAMVRRMTSPELVGRTEAIAQLEAAIASARDGEPHHVVIGGEAGVGKTRLLARSAELATAGGARVLLGGCVAIGEAGLPFAPYTAILRTLVARDGAPTVSALAGPGAADLARLVPTLSPDTAPPEQELWAQARLYEALLVLLRRYAERAPLVVQLEDLHWADAGTLAATSFLMRALVDEPVTLVATFRLDEVTRRHPLRPWLAEISRDGRVERIDLEPLDAAEMATLVHNILDRDLRASDLAEIHERSDGNPFFVEELLASGVDGTSPLPSSLRDVLLARVETLPEASQELIGVAGIGGRVVEHDALVAVAGRADDGVAADLRALVDAGLLVPTRALDDDDAYSFRHALLQEAVCEAMLPTERRRLHRGWVEVLMEHDATTPSGAAHLVELAHHLREARDPRALDASIAAADAAMAGYSFDIAALEYEEALRMWEPARLTASGVDHVEVLARTARAWMYANTDRRAVSACREAIEELGDGHAARRAELFVLLGRVLWISGEWGASTEAYEEAARIAPEEPADTRTRALAGLGQVYMLDGQFSESLPLCEEAVKRARLAGHRELEGHGLNTMGVDLTGLGRVEEGLAAIDEALAIAMEQRLPDEVGRAWVNRMDILMWAGRIEDAMACATEGIRVVSEMGMALSYSVYIRYALVCAAFIGGRFELASDQLRESDRVLPPSANVDQYRAVYTLQYLAASGDPEASSTWELIRGRLDRLPPSEHTGQFYVGGIELAALDGRYDDGYAIGESALDMLSHIDGHIRASETARMMAGIAAELGLTAAAAGDQDGSTLAVERISRHAQLNAESTEALGRPPGSMGILLELDRAQIEAERSRLEGHATASEWEALADAWAASGRAYFALKARATAVEVADRAGDRQATIELLRSVHADATAMGAAPIAGRLERLARKLRVRLTGSSHASPTTPESAYGLTKREREVLTLVTHGKTNKQIAKELFISESTAGVHVSNILGKLGVATRTEAARVALAQDLVAG